MKSRVKPLSVETRRRRGLKRKLSVREAFADLLAKIPSLQAKPTR
jgi:hypothetical protein